MTSARLLTALTCALVSQVAHADVVDVAWSFTAPAVNSSQPIFQGSLLVDYSTALGPNHLYSILDVQAFTPYEPVNGDTGLI